MWRLNTTSRGQRPDVHTFTATDYDMDTIEWSLLGTDTAHLEIGATSGILTFKQDSGLRPRPVAQLRAILATTPPVTAAATPTASPCGATDDDATDQKLTDYAVVVTVTDVNEAPEFTGTPDIAITLDEHDANDPYAVMDLVDYDARDEEGEVTWSLTGTDRLDFAISADGVVTSPKRPTTRRRRTREATTSTSSRWSLPTSRAAPAAATSARP